MQSTSSRVLSATLASFFLMTFPGCLKSRLQVRGDESEAAGKPVPTQVQDVQPQGGYAIEEIKGEMTRLTGRVEDLERSKNGADATSVKRDDYKKLEQRVIELEQAQAKMLEAITQMQAGAKAAASAAQENPGGTYEKAKSALEDGDYDTAIEGLTAYLKSPKPKFLEEATFLRAEAYFATKQFKKAIVDYSRFPEKFTKSKHMPAALYQIGRSFEALGMKEDARGFYQELVEKYPKSPEGKKARNKAR